MKRRGFLKSILALGAAPAIVRAESLMKVVVPKQEIITPVSLWGNRTTTFEESLSKLYNRQLIRQDEFGETFFPTMVLEPTESGVLVPWDQILAKPDRFPPSLHLECPR